MKIEKWFLVVCLALLLPTMNGCGAKKQAKDQVPKNDAPVAVENHPSSTQLPVRYQSPSYVAAASTAEADIGKESDEYQIKVGATIRSTGGPQPLWDVMKRLANMKGMTVSWASDVDRTYPVDVDISADDNFFDAIENLLRQADFFHTVQGKTIIVKNKDTRIYQIGAPAMKGGYTSTVGGNFLSNKSGKSGDGGKSGTEGTIRITSEDNKFDIWANIETNLKVLLGVIETGKETTLKGSYGIKSNQSANAENANLTQPGNINVNVTQGDKKGASKLEDKQNADSSSDVSIRNLQAARQTADDGAYYVIDKSIGSITVTAKPVILKNVENYINNLKKQLYRQVALEAKIIEVYLSDNSKIGLDWSKVLNGLNIKGRTYFGTAGSDGGNLGQVYPWIPAVGTADSVTTFVSKVALETVDFSVLLNALSEQGDTHVLANPKVTVMNGQPALLSVGKDTAYIKTVTKDIDNSGNSSTITYTAEVDNVVQGVQLGVMASILDDKKVVLHLTPITTTLEGGTIQYKKFGDEGLEIGLPVVNIREMSTMVEVENGEMLVIGGLIDSVEGTKGSFAPLVGSIPIIKYLFGVEEKVKTRKELVILLSPKII